MMTEATMAFVIDDDQSLRKSLARMLDAAHLFCYDIDCCCLWRR